jgi:hypothetical protein
MEPGDRRLTELRRESALVGLDFRHPDGIQGAFRNEILMHLRGGERAWYAGASW